MWRVSRLLCAVLPVALANPAAADDVYGGKTITIITSTGAGGAYDLTARTLARFLSRHIPGSPAVVVRNMPGGGHTLATNFMFTTAPRDGTYLATVANTVPLHQVLDGRGVRYDVRRFGWIGSTGISNLLTVAWKASGITSIRDALERQIVTGATGSGSGAFIYPNAMNQLLGTKFKIVSGYATSAEIDLAMMRGEIEARSGASLSSYLSERADWIREDKLRILTQVGAVREKTLPDVPLMHELARSEEQGRILRMVSSPVLVGRPYFTTPEVAAERLALLRTGFVAALQDAEFLAEAATLSLDLNPLPWDQLARVIEDTVGTPPELVAKAKSMMEPAP